MNLLFSLDDVGLHILLLLSFGQLPEHVRRAAMEASSDDDSDEDGEGGGKFEAGWGKNRYVPGSGVGRSCIQHSSARLIAVDVRQ